jgi:hypothetical protein
MLSFLEAPKGFIKKEDIHRKRMVWQEIDDKKRYHTVNWHAVYLPQRLWRARCARFNHNEHESSIQMDLEAKEHTRDLENNAK